MHTHTGSIRTALQRWFRYNPARDLRQLGHEQYRQRVRNKVDEQRKVLGMPAIDWTRLG